MSPPKFIKKVKEQERWMACRKEKPLNIDEELKSPSSPIKNLGSAQQPILIKHDEEEEIDLVQTGSATNASNVPIASSDTVETSEQSDTEPEAMEV